MQGVEVVDRILTGAPEPTLTCPDLVNRGYNPIPDQREQIAATIRSGDDPRERSNGQGKPSPAARIASPRRLPLSRVSPGG